MQQWDQRLVMVAPSVPGVSDRLRKIASSFGLWTWFTFPGKVPDMFTEHRGRTHKSKSRYSVYCCQCSCGIQYVGESNRNLKVRVAEHLHASSGSAFSSHLRANLDHSPSAQNTVILASEKSTLKCRILESLCIENKAAKRCNTGLSIEIPPIWKICTEAVGHWTANVLSRGAR